MNPSDVPGADVLSRNLWEHRYRHDAERDCLASLRRVARALAAPEGASAETWAEQFLALMRTGRFIPGGRILAGAGTGRKVTLANCFVMGPIEDSIRGIFDSLRDGAVTMQQGGGVGYDFSTLRPRGARAGLSGGTASGPVSFLHVWDRMCETLQSSGLRRGAMMATLRCDHPDIEDFITAKRKPGVLRNFNLSVLVTDAFMEAVRTGTDWPLVFPGDDGNDGVAETGRSPREGRVHRRVDARRLWRRLVRSAHATAEPGVLFVDRINRMNNLNWCERITATNPCGEVPLPPFGACMLGSLELTRFVRAPFTPGAHFDLPSLADAARVAVRMLDNAINISDYPLPAQAVRAADTRRIGLGLMGLGDALILLGLRYDSAEGRTRASAAMETICHAAYRASIELAHEKGAFPAFRAEPYLKAPFIAALPEDIRSAIARDGIRNSHLTAIAPTGSISLLAGQVSSGIEPLLAPVTERQLRQPDGTERPFEVTAASVRAWQHEHEGLPPALVCATEIGPDAQLQMQGVLQVYVDNAISKTIALPEDLPANVLPAVFELADQLGLKGCTVFRANSARGCVIRRSSKPARTMRQSSTIRRAAHRAGRG